MLGARMACKFHASMTDKALTPLLRLARPAWALALAATLAGPALAERADRGQPLNVAADRQGTFDLAQAGDRIQRQRGPDQGQHRHPRRPAGSPRGPRWLSDRGRDRVVGSSGLVPAEARRGGRIHHRRGRPARIRRKGRHRALRRRCLGETSAWHRGGRSDHRRADHLQQQHRGLQRERRRGDGRRRARRSRARRAHAPQRHGRRR